MKALVLGDIVGEKAVEKLKRDLMNIQEKEKIDFTIANGENAANGVGLTRKLFNDILSSGVDIITMGNHTWDNEEIYDFIDDKRIVRQANITKGMPGKGIRFIKKTINR